MTGPLYLFVILYLPRLKKLTKKNADNPRYWPETSEDFDNFAKAIADGVSKKPTPKTPRVVPGKKPKKAKVLTPEEMLHVIPNDAQVCTHFFTKVSCSTQDPHPRTCVYLRQITETPEEFLNNSVAPLLFSHFGVNPHLASL